MSWFNKIEDEVQTNDNDSTSKGTFTSDFIFLFYQKWAPSSIIFIKKYLNSMGFGQVRAIQICHIRNAKLYKFTLPIIWSSPLTSFNKKIKEPNYYLINIIY